MNLRGVILAWLTTTVLVSFLRGADTPGPAWESAYQARLQWWSLQPLLSHTVPPVQDRAWVRNFVDAFILSRLEQQGIKPSAAADRPTLARRLSFALTGLPPAPSTLDGFLHDESPRSLDTLIQSLMASPHFGEHWARHWMDVVHYSDTHGYEWDAPAKNAWRYRDYLTRAFNADVPIKQLLLEQLAGDLIAPRLDASGKFNEALIGPMALRLGERRHGDNAAAEGVTQEAVANMIDTVGKGFLGTTVACAQCHDHKLDAVGQRDFYSLAGIFMSTRWSVRCLDVVDPNLATLSQLREIKERIRIALAGLWSSSRPGLMSALARTYSTNSPPQRFPETLRDAWLSFSTQAPTREAFLTEHRRRQKANQENLRLLADFTQEAGENGWRWEGLGMKHGLVNHGELVIREDGNEAVRHLLPAGRWSHVWSPRLAGALRSPLFEPGSIQTFSMELAAGAFAAHAMIVDQAFHSERMQFLDAPYPIWKTWTAGQFDTLEGGMDKVPRRSYLELATKSLNNYFPPRTAYGGFQESDATDERSWFGATRIYQHAAGHGPQNDLQRFLPLFDSKADWTNRFADLILTAVHAWSQGSCTADDVQLINEALQLQWLPQALSADASLDREVELYRRVEKKIQTDTTIGSAEEWAEARDERLGVRGSYTELGETVPRGNIRFLTQPSPPKNTAQSSGRLELARSMTEDSNPLTARVFVNRVWHHLFGEGLVRTPDDFGHLGEKPSHPELLDALALRFMQEGWSLKRLITLLVTSATWQQSSRPAERALVVDPENRLWHHRPALRLEAEAIRDNLLAVAGSLDPRLYGPPIDPYRTAQDPAKRLFSGPLDGLGRRSLYTKMTLMEPPRFLALFNQPIPKLTAGRRDTTQVPDQALALLNDPFVQTMARQWGARISREAQSDTRLQVQALLFKALGRPAHPEEADRLLRLAERSAELRGVNPSDLPSSQPVWQDVVHALFNLTEFIHVY
ncbi:MAG: DUF1553 domain-containing protein [Verrucomicrobiales bacterium]|nr:DUF1553 domain-containing protein [Verrucomicrobiales bacterium]